MGVELALTVMRDAGELKADMIMAGLGDDGVKEDSWNVEDDRASVWCQVDAQTMQWMIGVSAHLCRK